MVRSSRLKRRVGVLAAFPFCLRRAACSCGDRARDSAMVVVELRPLDASAPMSSRPNGIAERAERARVTACLDRRSGQKIMASMGSLALHAGDVARGFAIAIFSRGNGDIWLAALDDRSLRRVILIEEKAQGGHARERAREQPTFLSGYSRTVKAPGSPVRQSGSHEKDR